MKYFVNSKAGANGYEIISLMELPPGDAYEKGRLSFEIEKSHGVEKTGDTSVSEILDDLIREFNDLTGPISPYCVSHEESQYQVGQVLDTIPSNATLKNK